MREEVDRSVVVLGGEGLVALILKRVGLATAHADKSLNAAW